ncbi:MAG: hypothetical protein AAGF30_10015, partial [Pseudomonadota bacterium]
MRNIPSLSPAPKTEDTLKETKHPPDSRRALPPDLSAWGPVQDLHPLPGGARRWAFQGTLNGQPVIAKSHALP